MRWEHWGHTAPKSSVPIPIRSHPASSLLPVSPSPSLPLLPLLLPPPTLSLLILRHTAPQAPCHRAPPRPPWSLGGVGFVGARPIPGLVSGAPGPIVKWQGRGRPVKVVVAAWAWRGHAALTHHAHCDLGGCWHKGSQRPVEGGARNEGDKWNCTD